MIPRFRYSNVVTRYVAIACAFLITGGCSGRPRNVARRVTGKITLGGQPLAGATVVFSPTAGGSPSQATTNQNGEYKLFWARGIEGAQVGEHVVKINTYVEGAPSAKPPRPEVPEKVPFKYRGESPPTATVKSGSNTIDFALEPGPVEPPEPKGKTKGKAR